MPLQPASGQAFGRRGSVNEHGKTVSRTQAAFLILLVPGVLALLGGLLWTRLHWRPDVPPFGRRTRTIDVMLHPERYAKEDSLRAIRTTNLTGGLLLASAAGVVAYEIFRITSGQ
jgi:hypothetical protein